MSLNTPNVVIENPKARKIARTTLDAIGVLLGTLVIVLPVLPGGAEAWGHYTAVALAVWTYLRFAFGLGVDNPNTPKVGKYGNYEGSVE